MNHFKLLISALILMSLSLPAAYAQVWPKPKVVVIPLMGDSSTWTGPWAEAIEYRRSDLVEFDGSAYIALANHTSDLMNLPPAPALWDLVAASGANGMDGTGGVEGPAGSQGEQGVAGPAGPKGDVGAKGDVGTTGSIGATGAKGDIGAQGPTGTTGTKGDVGAQGVIGVTGAKGDAGAQGVIGVTGAKGDIGPQGVIGATGVKGDVGDKGDTGDTGPAGGNVVYTATLPISINSSTNTISFVAPAALTAPDSNMQPSLALNYICALVGIYPSRNWEAATIGQVGLFAGNFAPRGWALCDGQLLAISSNMALFSILGTTYGGDGRTTFALPDLRGRAAIGSGNGPGLSIRPLGRRLGNERNRF